MGDIMRVGVVGAGLMGSGIVREIDGAAAAAGHARIEKSLDRALTARKLTAGDRDAAILFAELDAVVK
jgi:3-hydroxybutyryl-CoA dehydrogenase